MRGSENLIRTIYKYMSVNVKNVSKIISFHFIFTPTHLRYQRWNIKLFPSIPKQSKLMKYRTFKVNRVRNKFKKNAIEEIIHYLIYRIKIELSSKMLLLHNNLAESR